LFYHRRRKYLLIVLLIAGMDFCILKANFCFLDQPISITCVSEAVSRKLSTISG
jgi:hypothetical protein